MLKWNITNHIATEFYQLEPEQSIAKGMMERGYRFIIWNDNAKPEWAKTWDQVIKQARAMGKGTRVVALES